MRTEDEEFRGTLDLFELVLHVGLSVQDGVVGHHRVVLWGVPLKQHALAIHLRHVQLLGSRGSQICNGGTRLSQF